MKRITMPAAFVSGLADGIVIGIGLKTGIEPSRESIALMILDAVCKNPVTGSSSVCGYLWLYGLLFFIIGMATMFEDICINGPLYLLGLIIGAAIMQA